MSTPIAKRPDKLRTIGNVVVGLAILVGGAWWAISTLTTAQESQSTAMREWSRVQTFIDQRWAKLKDLATAYETTRPNKIVNPFDYASGPPIFGQGTPEYTFQQHAKWNRAASLADQIEAIGEIERWMPDFLRSLEADSSISTNNVLAGFHRDLAISHNDLQMHMSSYRTAALKYNQKLNQLPASFLLRRFDLQPLPIF